MSTRLNARMRREIRQRLVGDRFSKRQASVESRKQKLAMDVYRDVYSESQRRRMARLPEGWLPTTDVIRVVFAGRFMVLNLPSRVRVPYAEDRNGADAKYSGDHKLAERWREIEKEQEAIREDRDRLNAEINAVLNSATTDEKLIEKWPEAEKVIREAVGSPAPKALPAVQMGKLNRELGLVK